MPTARLIVRVAPRSKRDAVQDVVPDLVRVRVAAPPEKGRANEALVSLLARSLGVSLGAVSLVRGAAARQKVIVVEGISTQEALARLRALVQKS